MTRPPKPAAPVAWTGGRPLYLQLEEALVARVSSGTWAPGTAIPGEPALAAEFQVSISTVRAAVRRLAERGVLDRIQGRGTFVASRGAKDSVYRFFHLHPDRGARELPRSELVLFGRDNADERLAHELELGESRGERRIFRLRNVLRMGEEVVQVSDIAVPEAVFPGLTARRLTEGGTTLYGAYQALFGVTVLRTEDAMKADLLPQDVAASFDVKKGSPGLRVRRIAFTFHDRPVEARTTWMRTDRYHFLLRQGG